MPSFTSSLVALSLAASAVAHQTIWSRTSFAAATAAASLADSTTNIQAPCTVSDGLPSVPTRTSSSMVSSPAPSDLNAEANLSFFLQTETHSPPSDLTGSRMTGGSEDPVLVLSLPSLERSPSSSPEDQSPSRSPAMSLGRPSALAPLIPTPYFRRALETQVTIISLRRSRRAPKLTIRLPLLAGAYHSGDPADDFIDDSMLSGCALGIADVDNIEDVGHSQPLPQRPSLTPPLAGHYGQPRHLLRQPRVCQAEAHHL